MVTHQLNPKTHLSTLMFYLEKGSRVILIVVLPHVSYETSSVLCVLLLDVCLGYGLVLLTSLLYLLFSSSNS